MKRGRALFTCWMNSYPLLEFLRASDKYDYQGFLTDKGYQVTWWSRV